MPATFEELTTHGVSGSDDECADAVREQVFIVAARGATGDPAIPLRLLASVHRRGVDLIEAPFVTSSPFSDIIPHGRMTFTGKFAASRRQARTLLHTIDAVIGIEHVELAVESHPVSVGGFLALII